MLNDLAILKTLSAMASHASRRHSVIAENIANADTPGFKAKDVQSFAEIYSKSAMEGADVSDLVKKAQLVETQSGVASVNGNTVSLDEQMLVSAEVVGQHDMALTVYRKTLDMLKMAVSKNL